MNKGLSRKHITSKGSVALRDGRANCSPLLWAFNGTDSLRRTNASLIYRLTKNLRAVQLLFGHTKLEGTVWYLGG